MKENHTFPTPDDPGYLKQGNLGQVPANVSYLALSPGLQANPSTIGFKWHSSSQHISIDNFQPPAYYEDYVMTATYSETMQALQASQVDKLASLCEGDGTKSFVEIGCGDGSFMRHARNRFDRILGIEPSQRFAEEAVQQGFDVIIDYVGSQVSLTAEKFDVFASRQVFEHLPDPADVLNGIKKLLNPGAVGLIEVPNGYRALRLKRFFEFFPDHVNYYSVNSLVALASDAGFNVISCHESFGGDYLELWLRNELDVESWFNQVSQHRDRISLDLSSSIRHFVQSRRKVIIWGCGAKTLSILATFSDETLRGISGIVDSDPHKQGKYVPNTAIPIFAPDHIIQLRPGVVYILALSYRNEIVTLVRELLFDEVPIFTLDDQGILSEL